MKNRLAFNTEWLYGIDFNGRIWTNQNSEQNHFYWNGEIWVLGDIPENIITIDHERAVGYIFDDWKLLEIKSRNLYIANPNNYNNNNDINYILEVDRNNITDILYDLIVESDTFVVELNEFKKETNNE